MSDVTPRCFSGDLIGQYATGNGIHAPQKRLALPMELPYLIMGSRLTFVHFMREMYECQT